MFFNPLSIGTSIGKKIAQTVLPKTMINLIIIYFKDQRTIS
jgi:hypothetical protein